MKEDTQWRLRDTEGKEYIIIDSKKVDLQEELNKTIVKQQEEIERLNKRVKECEEAYLRTRHQYSELENKYLTDEHIINELEKKLKELIRDSLKGYEKYEENWEKRISVSNTWLTGRDDYMSVLNNLQKLKGNNKEYFYITSKEVEEDLLGDSSN